MHGSVKQVKACHASVGLIQIHHSKFWKPLGSNHGVNSWLTHYKHICSSCCPISRFCNTIVYHDSMSSLSLSRLGPTFFFEDPVSPAVVQHIHKLGPCYIGSFQSPTLNQSVRHLHMRHPSLLSPSFPISSFSFSPVLLPQFLSFSRRLLLPIFLLFFRSLKVICYSWYTCIYMYVWTFLKPHLP